MKTSPGFKRLPTTIIVFCLLVTLVLCACSSNRASSDGNSTSEEPKYAVTILIECRKNFMFSKYDVDISVDGEGIGNVEHGGQAEFKTSLTKGQHELVFKKENCTEPDGRTSLVVEDEGDQFSYKISCTHDQIDIEPIKQKEEKPDNKQNEESVSNNTSSNQKKSESTSEEKKQEAEKDGKQSEANKSKTEEKASKPPHIAYTDVNVSAIRDRNDTIYVVVNLNANCDEKSGFDDQAIIHCKVSDRNPYEMRPLPTGWEVGKTNEGRSYSNEPLKCSTRFNAEPGEVVSFWIDNPKSGATFEGLDGLVDQLTTLTTDAINTPLNSTPSPPVNSDERVCYVTPNGYSYHSRKSCPRLSRSKELLEMTVGDAKDADYEPCDFCC